MALFSVGYEVKDINQGTGPNTGTGEPIIDAFYKVDANFANISNFLRSDTVPLVMEDALEGLDIDTEWDWTLAEALIKHPTIRLQD